MRHYIAMILGPSYLSRERRFIALDHAAVPYEKNVVTDTPATIFSMPGEEDFRRFYDSPALLWSNGLGERLLAEARPRLHLDEGQDALLRGHDIHLAAGPAVIA